MHHLQARKADEKMTKTTYPATHCFCSDDGTVVEIVPCQVEPGSNEEASWASKSPDGASLVDCRDLAPSPEEGDTLVVSESGVALRYADEG
jgi:hypothetical protein